MKRVANIVNSKKARLGTVNERRIKNLVKAESKGPVVYWMNRDQRVQDNWALLHAQSLAIRNQNSLIIAFCLADEYLFPLRQTAFMLRGLDLVRDELIKLNIDFCFLKGNPVDEILNLMEKIDSDTLVTDFCPLRTEREWISELEKKLTQKGNVGMDLVDAHNIVPCWIASDKQEVGARTIRKKLWSHSNEFLEEFPLVEAHPFKGNFSFDDFSVDHLLKSLEIERSISEVKWIKAGHAAAMQHLDSFLSSGIKKYAKERNIPFRNSTSGLSPWLHFGQLSPQRCILNAIKCEKENKNSEIKEGIDSFIEELFIRRELSDNFCFYNPKYDSVSGAASWAKETLRIHSKDKREYIYSDSELEKGQTHDTLWNAAQFELVKKGKMHGFMRMYWAKKILEWTKSPEDALEIAIRFNDKYSLDGSDPNGFVGCMWSICGVHDQGWKEREIFGKIRFMNWNGCKTKFKLEGINKYIEYANKL